MDIFIAVDADQFIHGITGDLESAKELAGGEPGATIVWEDGPLGGSYGTIDRHNGWGPQHWAIIERHELADGEIMP